MRLFVRADVNLIAMFIRFILGRRLRDVGVPAGIFSAAYRLRDSADTPLWIADQIGEEIAWFEANLAVPHRFCVETARGRRPRYGVCWFKADAHAHVRHAHALVDLIGEAGHYADRLITRDPGVIVYRDHAQVVAQPDRGRGLVH